jgi:hypothetical protein
MPACALYRTGHKSAMTRNIPAPAAAATKIKLSSPMNSPHGIRDH